MNKKVAAIKTADEIRAELSKRLHTIYDPDAVLVEAQEKIETKKEKAKDPDYDGPEEDDNELTAKDPFYKVMTLSEFHNGALMIAGVAEQYRTFAIDMLRKLKKEYNCTTLSEKSTAELVTISFVRILELQLFMHNCLANPMGELEIKVLPAISKELDRANRHYLTALQTLRMLKQPPINLNIKANTAFVGQNQLIQENQNVKPI